MKPLLVVLTGMQLTTPPKTGADVQTRTATNSVPLRDEQQARQAVVDFLVWYKNHHITADRYVLVNQRPGKPYSVNLKNGDRYLNYLNTSHLLTSACLSRWRLFFQERDASFRLHPQSEGPPDGFEFDLIMLNQDTDKQLASLSSLTIEKVTITNGQALVVFRLIDAYEFRLVYQNRRWLIDEILSSSQH